MAEFDFRNYGFQLGVLRHPQPKVVDPWFVELGLISNSDPHVKLVRAGFLRQVSPFNTQINLASIVLTSQAHSGIFHMLPLGRRVQNKLEALIDKYMYQLGEGALLPLEWVC